LLASLAFLPSLVRSLRAGAQAYPEQKFDVA
jgi:hypothetical protein